LEWKAPLALLVAAIPTEEPALEVVVVLASSEQRTEPQKRAVAGQPSGTASQVRSGMQHSARQYLHPALAQRMKALFLPRLVHWLQDPPFLVVNLAVAARLLHVCTRWDLTPAVSPQRHQRL
jgi:hypothetical protein